MFSFSKITWKQFFFFTSLIKNIICSIHFVVPTEIFRIIKGKVLTTIIIKNCYGKVKI